MNRINNLFLRYEKNILDWSYRNRIRIYRFLLIAASLKLTSSIPYLNLVISPAFTLYFIGLLAILIFNITSKTLIIFCFFIFIFLFGLTLIGATDSAEAIGDFIYFILIYITIKSIFHEE